MTMSKIDTFVVSAAWLLEHLDDPAVAIADCRFSLADSELGRQQYLAAHIPGAYHLDLNRDLSSPVQKHGGRHPLPDPAALASQIAAMGVISPQTLVVAYDDSRCAFAARLWWLLRYLGHDRVAILDGGWKNWQQAGYPTTNVIPSAKNGSFVPEIRPHWVLNWAEVQERQDLPGVVLVDSRERERYLGDREPIDPVAGHIPGAVNYPWQEVTDADGYLQPANVQRDRWSDLTSAAEIVVYCGSGVTACVNLLSLEMAGITTSKLYAGSWSDWCSYL